MPRTMPRTMPLARAPPARGHRRARANAASTSGAARARARGDAVARKRLEVLTFDLDDTLWPTAPVIAATNASLIAFCRARLGPTFPDGATVHEAMGVVRAERARDGRAPMSYAALRIAGATRAAIEAGIDAADATAVVARGYHLAWIPTRSEMAERLRFPGVAEALAAIRARHPGVVVGSVTNGFGSAAGAGLGEFFDFEISAEALIDEHMVHGEMARKPNEYPFQLALGIAIGEHGYSGDPETWTHVGDDVLNDCYCAKQFDFKTVHVWDPEVKPYESAGGAPTAEKTLRGGVESNRDAYVDGVVPHVRDLPRLLEEWYL